MRGYLLGENGEFGGSMSVQEVCSVLKKKGGGGTKWSISVWILLDVYETSPNLKIYPFICL